MGVNEVYGESEVDGSTVYALMPRDGFLCHVPGRFVGGRWLGRIADTRFPGPFLPDSTHHSFTEISAEFNAYHILNWLVYLASNRFIDERDQWHDLLELLEKHIPRKIVSVVFASNSFSIRAIWDNAIRAADDLNCSKALAFLIETILDLHFDWIEPIMNKHVLFAAAKSGSAALIRKLLAKGAHPGWVRPWSSFIPYRTAITAAISVEAWDSVQLLLQKCEVEADLSLPTPSSTGTMGVDSQFNLLFRFIEADMATFWRTDPEDGLRFFSRTAWSQKLGSYMIALRLFLQAGANVDAPYIWTTEDFKTSGSSLRYFHEVNLTPLEWLPTHLELCLYWGEQLFNYLQTYSKVHDSTQVVTRSGILKALLDGGNDGLDQYFRIRSRPAPHVLEMLLVEQFFIDVYQSYYSIDRVNARTVRLLIEYGVPINSNEVQNAGGISLLLRRVIASARTFGLDEDLRFILPHLIHNGAVICKHALQLAVGRRDIHVLEVLASHGADISQDGKFALLTAVNMRNYQALTWLLDNGVSVASEFPSRDSPSFYTLIGAAVAHWSGKSVDVESLGQLEADYGHRHITFQLDIEMIRFLHGKGAQLRQQTSDLSSYRLLKKGCLTEEDFVAFIGDFPQEMARLSDSERKDLFAACGYRITCDQRLLESLRSRYEDFDTGVLLTNAIRRGASYEAIERPLGDTSDVNFLSTGCSSTTPLHAAASVYKLRLVQVLLGRGADINGRVGDGGFSPLEAACSYKPLPSERAEDRNRVIRFLVDQGADCYARGNDRHTPLHTLAECGDLENLRLFLEHGVDPNYARYENSINGENRFLFEDSPLDRSVQGGRLDATHLLLKVGGLSADPGHTGYEGALMHARHGAMRELIERHIQQMRDDFSQHPELEQKHRAMIDQQFRRREQAARDMGLTLSSWYEIRSRSRGMNG